MKLVRLAVATLALTVIAACSSGVTGPSKSSQPTAPSLSQGTLGSPG